MAEIPEDIVLEILALLPFKSLVRFKLLNKLLEQLISAPCFQDGRALLRSKNNTDFGRLLCKGENYNTLLTIEELPSSRRRHGEKSSYSTVVNCRYSFHCGPIILTSSGGLLLLWLLRKSSRNQYGRRTFCIFNPAIGAYRFIPYCCYKFIGFGLAVFVSEKNFSSFTLVAVLNLQQFDSPEDEEYVSFQIFDSESNYWRRCHSEVKLPLDFYIEEQHKSAYSLNDSLYWLTDEEYILVFNVKTEVGEVIMLPQNHGYIYPDSRCLGAINDELTLITIEDNNTEIFLWKYDFINRTWKNDRIFKNYIIPNNWSPDLISTPVFYDRNLLILALISVEEEYQMSIEGITADSIGKIIEVPISHMLWRTFRHYIGTLTKIAHCQYLVNGLKGMKGNVPDDPCNVDNQDLLENLLFISKCCSCLE